MSGLPTGHVGDLGAALVDEQLDGPTRDLVLRHLIGCIMCRHDVEEQRQLKERLRGLAAPGLPGSLFHRLSALNEPHPPPVNPPLLPPLPPADDPQASFQRTFVRDSHRGRRLLAGAASLLLVGAGTAFAAASDGRSAAPSRTSAALTASDEDNAGLSPNGESAPFNDPAFTAMTASFSR